MKKNYFLLMLLFTAEIAFAQKDDGRTMIPILTDAVDYIDKVEGAGNEIVRMEFDILKDEKETFRYLYEGWTYGICAFGDYRLEDIDIQVYKDVDDTWSLITKDEDASGVAIVKVKPVNSGMYKIVVKAYKFAYGESGCHYGLIIFHE